MTQIDNRLSVFQDGEKVILRASGEKDTMGTFVRYNGQFAIFNKNSQIFEIALDGAIFEIFTVGTVKGINFTPES